MTQSTSTLPNTNSRLNRHTVETKSFLRNYFFYYFICHCSLFCLHFCVCTTTIERPRANTTHHRLTHSLIQSHIKDGCVTSIRRYQQSKHIESTSHNLSHHHVPSLYGPGAYGNSIKITNYLYYKYKRRLWHDSAVFFSIAIVRGQPFLFLFSHNYTYFLIVFKWCGRVFVLVWTI